MSNILISYGTRPEYIKIKPILDKLPRNKYKLLFTGQHENIAEINYDKKLTICDGYSRLDSIVSSSLNNNDIFDDIKYVMVMGDTTSAFAIALASFHRSLPVIHLEAGLRTFDINNPYPEEFNRRAISNIASINLCPTENNHKNLINEKCPGKCYVVGNTSVDNLVGIKTKYGNDIIVTLHRRENHPLLNEYFTNINILAINNPDLNFICPLHPNPNVYKHKDILKNVNVVKPLSHENFIKILSGCRFIISDSGGIQEEASYLNKKVIVCRKTTERQESIDKTSFVCDSPDKLLSIFNFIKNNYITDEICPFGDGHASDRIVKILNQL